jgi:hypothetical protein
MYCPKCGLPMEKVQGLWRCTSGGLDFSQHLGEQLEARFAGDSKPGRVNSGGLEVRRWYCPACGVPLDSECDCPECRKSIRDLTFELIERHPHADGRGGYL